MRVVLPCSLVGIVLMAVSAGASAQAPQSDPEADSPSGVVYELPVDRARKDAAPRRGSSGRDSGGDGSGSVGGGPTGGGPTGGGSATDGSTTPGGSQSAIRSENNFGTSSRVPGADSRPRGGRRGESGGGGSNASGAGAVESFGQLAPSSATGAGDGPSDTVVFLLLGVLLAVGAAIGVVAGRRAARDRPS